MRQIRLWVNKYPKKKYIRPDYGDEYREKLIKELQEINRKYGISTTYCINAIKWKLSYKDKLTEIRKSVELINEVIQKNKEL